MDGIYWLIIFVVLLVIEFATMGLTTIWFAGGAVGGMIASYLGGDIIVQLIVFFIISLALLIVTRPLAVKYMNNSVIKTNAESLIGQTAKVIEPISNADEAGRVIINGQEWAARTSDSKIFVDVDTMVSIKEIQGVKLIVDVKEMEE